MRAFPGNLSTACLLAVAATCGASWAEIITLRNGQQLRGRVTIEGEKARIELDVGATLVVDRGEIAKTVVERAPRAGGEGAAAVSPAMVKRLAERERVHGLLEALLGDDEGARSRAEKELCKAGRQALPMVRQAFGQARGREKLHLVRVLAALGDRASAPALEAVLRNPQEKDLHAEAARALVALRGPGAQWALTELLVASMDRALRAECVRLLAGIRSAYGAPFVAAALGEEGLGQTACRALSGWHDPVLLPFLLPLLDEGSREAQERVGELVAGAVTPAHAAALGRLLDLYRGERGVAKALAGGVQRLHREFPVVGDVELLGCSQDYLRKLAEDSLRRQFHRRRPSPRDWAAERARATAPRLVVVPVGAVAPGLLKELAFQLGASLRAPDAQSHVPVVAGPAVTPPVAREPGVCDGPAVLSRLARHQRQDHRAVRLVGVTVARVWMPGLEEALAPTWPGGPVLVSLHGMGEGKDEVVRRARRLALHGLARSFGLGGCGDATCPSGALYAVGGLEAVSPRFCGACLGRVSAMWAAEAAGAAFDYAGAARALAALATRSRGKGLLAALGILCERGLEPSAAIARWRAFEKAGGPAAVVARRVELLDKAARWFAKRGLRVNARGSGRRSRRGPNPPG